MTRPAPCIACAGAPASHLSLWLGTVADGATLRLPLYALPFYRPLMRLAEAIVNAMGEFFYVIGRTLHFVSLSSDTGSAVSTRSRLLWEEAIRRGISMQQVFLFGLPTDIFRVRYGTAHDSFRSLPLMPEASALRMDDKVLFKRTMEAVGVPVPRSFGVSRRSQASGALQAVGTACVKPRTGSNARHTYPNVRTEAELDEAFDGVKQISAFVTVEEYLEGNLCRATCVDGTLIGFLESAYPNVTGDGVSTIEELVAKANETRLEGIDPIEFDAITEGFIARRGYARDSVLPEGATLALSYRGGTSVGGSNREHGRNIHPSFIPIIEKAAQNTGLHIVGFDIIIPDPMQPQDTQRWGFIEANSLPWIDLHAHPYYGEPIDVSSAVWDLWLSRTAASHATEPSSSAAPSRTR